MKTLTVFTMAQTLALGLAVSGPVLAKQPEDAPPMATTPDATEEQIELPDEAASEAREAASKGLERANAAREDGRAFGKDRASVATSNREAATDNRGAERRR